MARRREGRRTKINRIVILLVSAVVAFCVLGSIEEKHGLALGLPKLEIPSAQWLLSYIDDFGDSSTPKSNALAVSTTPISADLEVHMIDVDQAKSILIKAPEKTVLIDAGENSQGMDVVRYLNAHGVTSIDILIGTHPHSDHIGGMDTVIQNMPVGLVILPDLPDELVPTTKTYTDMLEAILDSQLPVQAATPGNQYPLGDNATLTILAPTDTFPDLNDMSVMTRLVYQDTSFLFTGDAGMHSEARILKEDLQADVLEVGHHGSNTSTSQAFLDVVQPRVALISCGVDNSYGHPHREVVERLKGIRAEIYRTDLNGTVVVYSDGQDIQVQTQK